MFSISNKFSVKRLNVILWNLIFLKKEMYEVGKVGHKGNKILREYRV